MSQLALFQLPPEREPRRRPARTVPAPPPLEAARARGEAGAAAAARRAEEATGTAWTQTAAALIAEYARRNAGVFLIESARFWAASRVPAPPDQRAWGSATKVAVRRGWIIPAGFAPARSSNGSPRPAYRAAP